MRQTDIYFTKSDISREVQYDLRLLCPFLVTLHQPIVRTPND